MVGPAWRRSAYSHGLSRVQGRVDTRAMAKASPTLGGSKGNYSVSPLEGGKVLSTRFASVSVPHLAWPCTLGFSRTPTTGFIADTHIHRGRGARARNHHRAASLA